MRFFRGKNSRVKNQDKKAGNKTHKLVAGPQSPADVSCILS